MLSAAVAANSFDSIADNGRRFVSDVLIVDDDPVLRGITELFFKKRGAGRIRSAGDGVEGLAALKEAQGDVELIVCDLNMPNLDGIQFLRHLGEAGFGGGVLLISSDPPAVVKAAESLARAHRVRLVGALRRPVKIDQLEEAVHRFLVAPDPFEAEAAEPIDIDELTYGIANNEITAVYQPKLDVATLSVRGVEALARWNHPHLGSVAPGRFVPTAEEFGLIGELTEAVLSRSIAASQRWRARGIELSMAVNISSQLLARLNFPDELRDKVVSAGLEPRDFVLEVTESRLLQRDPNCAEVLARLRLMGFELSIDDFGTGHSNIEHLRAFPFSELKIDQSFVRHAADDPFARASIDASVSLGKNLGLRLVAEGIETGKDWLLVTEAGVDQVQGFYIARPMSAEAIERWMLNATLDDGG